MKKKLWKIISNPPMIKIQGIRVPAWKVPSIEDGEAIVDAIVKIMPITITPTEREWTDILDWIKESYNESSTPNHRKE